MLQHQDQGVSHSGLSSSPFWKMKLLLKPSFVLSENTQKLIPRSVKIFRGVLVFFSTTVEEILKVNSARQCIFLHHRDIFSWITYVVWDFPAIKHKKCPFCHFPPGSAQLPSSPACTNGTIIAEHVERAAASDVHPKHQGIGNNIE